MNGILNIDKPAGRTSFSIVAMVKRLTGEKHVGHAGTLDPMARGVLPVCLGQATRLVEYLMSTTKAYRAEIEFGIVTDTYDSEGEITHRNDASGVTLERLKTALDSFRGVITQIPPMYSAVKQKGRPLYQLARAGVKVERKGRIAVIQSLELKDWRLPVATIEVICGKGTYIRSLAHDLGQGLGCGAVLKSLVRLRCGVFSIDSAVSVEDFEEACESGYWESLLYPMDSVLTNMGVVIVDEEKAQLVRNGSSLMFEVDVSSETENGYRRAYTRDGNLLGILRFDSEKKQWQPEKVFG
ncbi:MAG: tRNA pseudouridine(55) synthase TruB [Dehalococcoidales bacterium]|nr:tRNA pseudouridine(55) synthase TruB [Dehalococcoidales bacterium]